MTPKDIRKQLRNVVQEELKNVILTEIKTQVSKELAVAIQKQLAAIETMIREKLTVMDERSKDTMGYLVRQVSKPAESPAHLTMPSGEVAKVESDGSFKHSDNHSFKSE